MPACVRKEATSTFQRAAAADEFGRVLATLPEIHEADLVSVDYDSALRCATPATTSGCCARSSTRPRASDTASRFVLRVLKEASIPL